MNLVLHATIYLILSMTVRSDAFNPREIIEHHYEFAPQMFKGDFKGATDTLSKPWTAGAADTLSKTWKSFANAISEAVDTVKSHIHTGDDITKMVFYKD